MTAGGVIAGEVRQRVEAGQGDAGAPRSPVAAFRHSLARFVGWRRWLVAVILGALAVLALPPLHIVPALAPAFIGLMWLLDGARTGRAAAGVGVAFGVGYFTAGLYWVANALLTKPEQFGWLAPFAPVGLALILAPFLIVPAFVGRLAPPGTVGRVVVFAAGWTFAEWLRAWVLTGFPWNLVGSVWSHGVSMLQITAWIGVYGLGFLTVLAAALPAVPLGDPAARRRDWLPFLAAVAVLGAVALFGAGRVAAVGDVGTVDGVRLRLVQPNIPQTMKWREDLLDAHLLRQARMGSLPGQPRPTHVIWSEVAAPLFLLEDPARLAVIADHTPPGGLTLLGTLRRTPAGQPFQLWNSLVAIDSDRRVVAHYDKAHLVPFGEYMPLGSLLGIGSVVGFADFTPGAGIATMALPGLPALSPLICYEVIFPAQVTDRTARPAWLLNITNDGWYGRSAGPYQHLAAARLRAVEEGLPLVRVANTGISAVFDPLGRERERIGLGAAGIIDADLPRPLAPTVYSRYGTWPLLLALVMIVVAATRFTRTR